jgi:hypothetical protein
MGRRQETEFGFKNEDVYLHQGVVGRLRCCSLARLEAEMIQIILKNPIIG